MKALSGACYNFVTLNQGYDKLHGPWTRALVDRALGGPQTVFGLRRLRVVLRSGAA
jgi:hypothetical protein